MKALNNNSYHVANSFFRFNDKETLNRIGARINGRLGLMLHDTMIVDNFTANRAFSSVYNDVRTELREKMFDQVTGEIIWTLATQLERAGYMVYKTEGGLNVHVGNYKLNVPSPVTPDYLSLDDIAYMAAFVNINNGVRADVYC